MIRVGYACQIAGLRGYTFKTCRLDNASGRKLEEITHENLKTLYSMLEYNVKNDIGLFRISSDVIPFASHPMRRDPWWETEKHLLQKIGNYILENGMRVSMHPGQYTVLNSENEEVAARALDDLKYHNRFLDELRLPASHKIILHIGGAYGNRQSALERFISRAKMLPTEIRRRLVLENDDRIFGIEDVLEVCRQLSLPAVFDLLHHECNSRNTNAKTVQEYLRLCGQTWKRDDGPQKIHYSQQREGAKCGVHSQTIDVDKWLLDCKSFDHLDVMLEVKDKNLSAIKCDMTAKGISGKRLEQEWAKYKYLVMRHSQADYTELRRRFGETIGVVDFFQLVEAAMKKTPTVPTVRNTAQHIWGYFKEKENAAPFLTLLNQYEQGKRSENAVFSYLYRLAVKWDERYLLDSYCFALEK